MGGSIGRGVPVPVRKRKRRATFRKFISSSYSTLVYIYIAEAASQIPGSAHSALTILLLLCA